MPTFTPPAESSTMSSQPSFPSAPDSDDGDGGDDPDEQEEPQTPARGPESNMTSAIQAKIAAAKARLPRP